MTHNGRHLRERAIAAILENSNVREASAASSIPERTLFRWLTLPDFRAELEQQKRSLVECAVNRLRLVSRGAVEALHAIAHDQAAPHAARVSAARAIVSLTIEAAHVADIEARLEVLEGKTKTIDANPDWNHEETSRA